ncbi:chloride channel protein [Cardiobacterium hominis]|uniref:chloride channel protein n=1 Tax=Cardiobacterium hominis TaxID=2718 RepID=UPI0028D66743|nr:chloride channel protein [Cardiobacterium hominis]
MLPSLGARSAKLRYFIHKKLRQSSRISRKTLELSCLLVGATLVALASLTFAALADYALDANRFWAAAWPLAPWFILPPGMALLAWFTRHHAPYVAGSGIPQVIAALGLPYGANKERLIAWPQTLWKIPLTFLAMLIGASVGREGPSVQVGAAVMLAWGAYCRRHRLAFSGLSANELIATGAAGGLAAAFNAPLAGIIFAIEELGRGLHLRWERRLLLGVLASGFILVAIKGNNPYFPAYTGATTIPHMIFWVALCGVVCGIAGGIFARLLAKGALGYAPAFLRGWLVRHPVIFAALLGLVLAAIGHHTHGQTYGTGYHTVAQALDGEILQPHYLGPAKLLATVATYWSGIAGGIFTPSLTTGAGIGSGLWVLTGGAADHNLLVLLCTAAFLAGATQSPVTASVVVMEMTGSQPLLIWLMTACLIATPVSRQIQPKPFYHAAAARYRQRLQAENAS